MINTLIYLIESENIKINLSETSSLILFSQYNSIFDHQTVALNAEKWFETAPR